MNFYKLKIALRNRISEWKMTLAIKWADQHGMKIVRIVRRGNVDYLVAPSGQMYKIGAKK